MSNQAERVGLVVPVDEAGAVKQHGWMDCYQWNKDGLLEWTANYSSVGSCRKFVHRKHHEGKQILVRQVIGGRVYWSQYAERADSGLGYTWDQSLDRFVRAEDRELLEDDLVTEVTVQLPLFSEEVADGKA